MVVVPCFSSLYKKTTNKVISGSAGEYRRCTECTLCWMASNCHQRVTEILRSDTGPHTHTLKWQRKDVHRTHRHIGPVNTHLFPCTRCTWKEGAASNTLIKTGREAEKRPASERLLCDYSWQRLRRPVAMLTSSHRMPTDWLAALVSPQPGLLH